MASTSTLISILERSVEINGEKPLTNKWLLNILKVAQRREFEKAEYAAMYEDVSLDD